MKTLAFCDKIFTVIFMTDLYLIRHCEGEGNIKHIFNGTTDCDISELGAKQLEKLSERFKNVKIDAVYSSPLKRARMTAHAVADPKGLRLVIEPGLIELYGGEVEGKEFQKTFDRMPDLKDAWNNHPQDFWPKDGESMRHGYDRIYRVILSIAKDNDGKSVAVASHGGVIRCLMARIKFGTIERLKDMPWAENTDVTLLRIDGEKIEAVYVADHSHLTEDMLPSRSKVSGFVKE